ncbi:unnamed protein product [Dicrocoelium dendriticum]|nr:unnamed protein product [Dicrocoelium dendriticum]
MQTKTVTFISIILGCVCIVAIISLCILGPVLHHMIDTQSRLAPGSLTFKQWSEPDASIFLQFYFFNLTNPREFRNGSKPRVQQWGPYTYRERRFKLNVEIDRSNDTISYKEIKQYFFVRNLSVGPESDLITTVNIVYLTLTNKAGTNKYFAYILELVSKYFGEQLTLQRSVGELIWGYDDPLLNFLKTHHFPVNTSKVGLYADKNNTDDGTTIIVLGDKNRDNRGNILSVRGSRSLSCWSSPSANQINGSDGSLFHPFLKPEESIFVFSMDICRSIEFVHVEPAIVHGIPCRKYLPSEDTLDSPLENFKNRGFCLHWPNCYGRGVLDLSSCQSGAPVAMSLPHFTHADQMYLDAVIGLHPSAEFNTTFFVEPLTGALLHAVKKLQLNANVTKNPTFRELTNVSTALIPIAFVNESVTLDSATARILRDSLVLTPLIIKAVSGAMLFGALATIFICAVFFLYKRRIDRTNAETRPLLSDADSQPIYS